MARYRAEVWRITLPEFLDGRPVDYQVPGPLEHTTTVYIPDDADPGFAARVAVSRAVAGKRGSPYLVGRIREAVADGTVPLLRIPRPAPPLQDLTDGAPDQQAPAGPEYRQGTLFALLPESGH